MMSKLPYGGFRWLETDEIDNLDIKTINSDGEICYILEVDLDYPKHLHDNHSDYPSAEKKKIITEDQISPVNQEFLKGAGGGGGLHQNSLEIDFIVVSGRRE